VDDGVNFLLFNGAWFADLGRPEMKNAIILLAGYLVLSSISCGGPSSVYYPYPPPYYDRDYWGGDGEGFDQGDDEDFDEGDDDDFDEGDEDEGSDEGEEDRR
jgi:hypothetical protein